MSLKRTSLLPILLSSIFISALFLPPPLPVVAESGSVEDVYVSLQYSGTIPGWGITHFDAIDGAVGAVCAGGTVHVAPGTYELDSIIRISKDILIVGDSYDTTVFLVPSTLAAAFVVAPGKSLLLRDLTIAGGTNGVISYGSMLSVARCEVSQCSGAAIVCGVTHGSVSVELSSSLFHHCGCGVWSYTVHRGTSTLDLHYCTIADNEMALSMINHGTSGNAMAHLSSSIVAYHASGAFSVPPHSVECSSCSIWADESGSAFGQGVVYVDPLLDRNTYRLDIQSPLIDEGTLSDEVPYDITGSPRIVGRAPDIGAFEGGRMVLLHMTDLHLLAPQDGELYVGVSYEPRLWKAEQFLSGVSQAMPEGVAPDVIVITGDIVDLASIEPSYVTPLGSVSYGQWDDTYRGYEAFKALCHAQFPGVPIFETVGNHDYREHPLFPWTWYDDAGIDDAFYDAYAYDPITIVPLCGEVGMESSRETILVLLNSGHDVLATDAVLQSELYPYIMEHAESPSSVIGSLSNIPPPEMIGEYIGMFAYGSGMSDHQMRVLSEYMAAHPDDRYVIACHHPIVYNAMTITHNIATILELVRHYDVPYVLSGHAHSFFEAAAVWDNGSSTLFEVTGAAMSGQYALVTMPLGNLSDEYGTYRAFP